MKLKKLAEIFRNDYVQTVIILAILVGGVLAFWYGLRFALGTDQPLFAVVGPSMEPVLYNGDLILVQGVHNACKINAAPKDADSPGDIIIFHEPRGKLIVHRAIAKIVSANGSCSFRTQGDNNPSQDGWVIEESDILGKWTGTKVPLLGHIALFFEPLYVKVAFIMLWIIILIIIEVFPWSRKRVEEEQTQTKPL